MQRYLILCLLLIGCFSDSLFHRNLLTAPSAVCLDGSPGAYYVSEGTGDDRNKVLIFFQGGGWCGGADLATTLQKCYERSLTDLGSSKNYSATLTFSGVLSGDSKANPEFYSWTRVFFSYCDGSGHQGFKNASVSYKSSNLFFRGGNITLERFKALNVSHKLFTADVQDIVVTGSSAGGLAAFHWGEYVKKNAKAQVWTVPDAGVFLDSLNVKTKTFAYRDEFINLMKLSNAEVDPPVPQCIKAYPTEKWRCMFAEYLYPHIQTPLFPVNSLYDTWSIPNILGISCINSTGSLAGCSDGDRHTIDEYKKNLTTVLGKIATLTGNGAWGISCAQHSHLVSTVINNLKYAVPGGSNNTIEFSIASWIVGFKQNNHIDTVDWPNNKACSGIAVDGNIRIAEI